MPRPALQLLHDTFTGPNFRPTIVLLTSALCLSAWHLIGSYNAWLGHVPTAMMIAGDERLSAAIGSLASSVILLGIVPLLVVKLVLRESLSDYGIQWGDVRFALICSVLVAPLVVAIGYLSAQEPAFQRAYPIIPPARDSSTALAWHLAGQIFWYAAWEFHFRGFLQHALGKSFTMPLGICVQTLASMLAHFGRPGSEVFASIIGGVLWGALAWRTRSLLAGVFQHWLLGASLDFFICMRFG